MIWLRSVIPTSLVQIYATVCLLAAPKGIERFCEQHSDVLLYTSFIDGNLDEHSYIIPGLGNAGDACGGLRLRLLGTQ
ncbi:uracil phosphoribosyltransferase [Nostoc sp. NMS2]|uniref:uracil phosphoribosyltransferase n=1 Tax=unclassified Nostoc TaxID=2593658 RepID=UPI003454950F